MPTSDDYFMNHRASGIVPGDRVRVTHAVTGYEGGWACVWNAHMTSKVGREFTVVLDRDCQGFILSSDADGYLWPYYVLEKLPPHPSQDANDDSFALPA